MTWIQRFRVCVAVFILAMGASQLSNAVWQGRIRQANRLIYSADFDGATTVLATCEGPKNAMYASMGFMALAMVIGTVCLWRAE